VNGSYNEVLHMTQMYQWWWQWYRRTGR